MVTATLEKESTASTSDARQSRKGAPRSRDHQTHPRPVSRPAPPGAKAATVKRQTTANGKVIPTRRQLQTRVRPVYAPQSQVEQYDTYTPPDDRWHFSLPKAFVYFSYCVALVVVLVFGLDLAIAAPFQRFSILFDVTNVICGSGLGYLSWNAHRDLR